MMLLPFRANTLHQISMLAVKKWADKLYPHHVFSTRIHTNECRYIYMVTHKHISLVDGHCVIHGMYVLCNTYMLFHLCVNRHVYQALMAHPFITENPETTQRLCGHCCDRPLPGERANQHLLWYRGITRYAKVKYFKPLLLGVVMVICHERRCWLYVTYLKFITKCDRKTLVGLMCFWAASMYCQ